MSSARFWRTTLAVGSPLALAAASSLVVVLGAQNRALEVELSVLRERQTLGLPNPGVLLPGFRTRSFEATGGPADSVSIGETVNGCAQVLIVFRSTCPHCQRTLPYWNRIAERIKAADLRQVAVYGLSRESEADMRIYARNHHFSFPVASFPSSKLAELYRVVGVPITLILTNTGVSPTRVLER